MALSYERLGNNRSVVHLVWLARRTDLPETDTDHLVVNPPFQRGAVWNLGQKQRWIETLLDDLPIPAIFVNTFESHPVYDSREVVIDGQQRLRTIAEFMKDEFCVRGEMWGDQTDEFRQIFGMSAVSPIVYTKFETEVECVELYLRLLTAGTAHTEAEIEKARDYVEATRPAEKRLHGRKKAVSKRLYNRVEAAAKRVRCRKGSP